MPAFQTGDVIIGRFDGQLYDILDDHDDSAVYGHNRCYRVLLRNTGTQWSYPWDNIDEGWNLYTRVSPAGSPIKRRLNTYLPAKDSRFAEFQRKIA